MSLQNVAQHLASRGRGEDSVLVHMTPGEVQGLQALAMAHGGSLSINPETGLPEAGWLSKLLPTVIGAAVTAFTGIPAWQVALGVGGIEAARTGDLGKGIAAGLGAYGGANIGSALASAGASNLAGSEAALAAGRTAAQNIPLETISAGAAEGISAESMQQAAAQQAAKQAAAQMPITDRLYAGLSGLTEKSGRDAFMQAMDGGKGLFRNAYMAAAPMFAGDAVKSGMPQTTTQPGRITPYITDQYGNLRPAGSYTPAEFPGFAALREKYGADGGLMSHFADGGDVVMSPGSTASYQRTSMSPGMLDFAQKSEPVVRMADGGFTDDQVTAAIKASLQQGINPQDVLNKAATYNVTQDQLNRATQALQQSGYSGLTAPTLAYQAPTPAPAPVSAPISGPNAIDPTQRATPTEAQLAAQQSIVADPQAAALAAARSGIAAGMTDQQIADMVNMQYGKSFSAQNVADFMKANQLTRPAPAPAPVSYTPPDLFPGVTNATPGSAVTGTPAIDYGPTPTTMGGLRDLYEQGGGATRMPTITDIKPTDRTYTQNQAFDLLRGYLQANPNAQYADVVAFARRQGIPDMQARAAYNEFRFSGLTGGSAQAYDYLMGRGAYPLKPFVPGGGPIMRSYAEMMGLPTTFTPKYLTPTSSSSTTPTGPVTPSTKLTAPSGVGLSEAERSQLGNMFVQAQQSGNYTGFNAMLQNLRLTPTDLLNLYPSLTPAGIQEWVDSGKVKFYEEPISGGATGGLAAAFAKGGMSRMELMGIEGAAAAGGHLGDYSDGGRLLRGPGDGVSDSIPATIADKRPARLADGEFVVPARIVSELGNGSTEAGARKLYAMMDRVQAARRKSVGKGKVAKDTKADKYLPA